MGSFPSIKFDNNTKNQTTTENFRGKDEKFTIDEAIEIGERLTNIEQMIIEFRINGEIINEENMTFGTLKFMEDIYKKYEYDKFEDLLPSISTYVLKPRYVDYQVLILGFLFATNMILINSICQIQEHTQILPLAEIILTYMITDNRYKFYKHFKHFVKASLVVFLTFLFCFVMYCDIILARFFLFLFLPHTQ